MGLDTSHGCWHGAYSAFMRWRRALAIASGLPPLDLMEGFYQAGSPIHDPFWRAAKGLESENPQPSIEGLPISWDCLKPSALHVLLQHSDCDGELRWQVCDVIANELEKLLPNLPEGDAGGHIGNWRDKTKQFIDGLRRAFAARENVEFH